MQTARHLKPGLLGPRSELTRCPLPRRSGVPNPCYSYRMCGPRRSSFATSSGFRSTFCTVSAVLWLSEPRRRLLQLRFVHEPVFTPEIRKKESLLSAFLDVENVKGLFAEYKAAGVEFVHPLRKEPWGASAFIVLDPDGNWICFAG